MKKRQVVYLSLLLVWILISAYLLLIPQVPLDDEDFSPPHSDKIIHLAIFGVMSFLFFKVYKEYDMKKVILYSFISALAIGILFETLQFMIPLREFSLFDMMFNTIGSSVVFFFNKKI